MREMKYRMQWQDMMIWMLMDKELRIDLFYDCQQQFQEKKIFDHSTQTNKQTNKQTTTTTKTKPGTQGKPWVHTPIAFWHTNVVQFRIRG